MSNYITTDTELTSVANAIRTKGGTSASLTYPAGFVSAIGSIPAQDPVIIPEDLPLPNAEYIRPDNYPDLSELTFDDTVNEIWLVCDKSNTTETQIKFTTSRYQSLERGHIENGEFVVDETLSSFPITFADYPDVFVIRVANNDGRCWLGSFTGQNDVIKEIFLNENFLSDSNQQAIGYNVRYINFVNWKFMVGDGLFYNCGKLIQIDGLENVSYSENFSFSSLFNNCYKLAKVDFKGNIPSRDMNATGMFNNCYNIRSITFGTTISINASSMFNNCYLLKEVDIENIVLSNAVSSINLMFSNCCSLECIDISHWTMPNTITGLNSLFSGCTNLKSFKLPNDISNIISFDYLFSGCKSLEEIDLSNYTFNDSQSITFNYTFNNRYIMFF